MKISIIDAKSAIKLSQQFDKVVHVADLETVSNDLMCKCDDYVENGEVTEFWGEDENGTWRVHVHFEGENNENRMQ